MWFFPWSLVKSWRFDQMCRLSSFSYKNELFLWIGQLLWLSLQSLVKSWRYDQKWLVFLSKLIFDFKVIHLFVFLHECWFKSWRCHPKCRESYRQILFLTLKWSTFVVLNFKVQLRADLIRSGEYWSLSYKSEFLLWREPLIKLQLSRLKYW